MELISKKEFAESLGLSKSAISKAKWVKPGLVGERVDIDHPDIRYYIEHRKPAPKRKLDIKKTTSPRNASGGAKRKAARKGQEHVAPSDRQGAIEVPEYLENLLDMTLLDVVNTYGTDTRFLDWLKAVKEIENIVEKRLKNAEKKGELIPREPVKVAVLTHIEESNSKIIGDAPRTISTRLQEVFRSGGTREEAEELARGILSGHLKNVKKRSIRGINAI